jgi:cullin-associated NEDD8-dissociated protein 1
VRACEKLFESPLDSCSQCAVFVLLSELVHVRHGGLEAYLAQLLPPILRTIESDRSSTGEKASIDALRLLRCIFEAHKFDALASHLPAISRVLCEVVARGPESNKIDALGVIGSVAKSLTNRKQTDIANALYKVVLDEFVLDDVPLPNKLATISALTSILSCVGEAELDRKSVSTQVMPIFLRFLKNDSTVQPTLRALTRIANASDTLKYDSFIGASGELVLLCRKSVHHIKDDVVRCMEAIMRRTASTKKKDLACATFSDAQIQVLLCEVAPLLNDNDLHLAHLLFDLASTSLEIGSEQTAALVASSILPGAIRIMLSPLLQGLVLSSLIKFLQACVVSGATDDDDNEKSPLHYNKLLMVLMSPVTTTTGCMSRSAYLSIAQCVAGTTKCASDVQAEATVTRFVGEVVSSKELGVSSQLALLVLGEIGRSRDLSAHSGLEAACLQAFDSKNEHVRGAAAFALGNIAVANLATSLPKLLQLTQQRTQAGNSFPAHHGYLLFSALKEIILAHSSHASDLAIFAPYADSLLPLLLASVSHSQESTRAMVAECLGRLAVMAPQQVLTSLESLTSHNRADVRGVAITAVRFCLHPLFNYSILYQHMSALLTPLIEEKSLEVRRLTLLSINAIARINIEALPRDTLHQLVLPTLYFETRVKPELVHEVDYGAFKKMIDDGAPLRRAAYQTLQTLLEVTPHRIDLPEFITVVRQGIRDEESIQLLSYQIFIELAKFHGSALLEVIDQLPTLIMDAVKKYIAETKTSDPYNALEVLRVIVRALLVFNQIPGVELCTKYMHFFRQVKATSMMSNLIKEQTTHTY